jgi:hypothetical protein
MNPLPDRVVLVALLTTIALCFALVFWTVRLQPRLEPPMQWRNGSSPLTLAPAPGSQGLAV